MRWKAFVEEYRFLPEHQQGEHLQRMSPEQRRDFEKAVEAYLPRAGNLLGMMNEEQRADIEKALENFGFRTAPPSLGHLAEPGYA